MNYEYSNERLEYIETLEARAYELVRKRNALEVAIKNLTDREQSKLGGLGLIYKSKAEKLNKILRGVILPELANARDNGYIRRIEV
jgi:hypothetical protein